MQVNSKNKYKTIQIHTKHTDSLFLGFERGFLLDESCLVDIVDILDGVDGNICDPSKLSGPPGVLPK